MKRTVGDAVKWGYRTGGGLWEWISGGRPSPPGCDDALFARIASDNAAALEFVFRGQRDVAEECRRSNIPCVEAIAVMRERSDTADRALNSLVGQSYHRLRDALVRVHTPGWCAACRPADLPALEDLRGLLELAESPDAAADAAAHLAELDRIAAECPAGTPAPLCALAAREAAEVRGRVQKRLSDAVASAGRAVAAAAPPPPREPYDKTPEEAARAIFELGYVEKLWRGIEHLLPEGVVETCGRMPGKLVRIGST